MLTLTYGYKKPENGDLGPVVFPALEGDIQQLNDHTHNGTDSALLTATSISSVSQAIAAGGWASPTNGIYTQTITMTSPYTYDGSTIFFRLTSTKESILLKTVKASSNSYVVYCNDNTLNVTASYR